MQKTRNFWIRAPLVFIAAVGLMMSGGWDFTAFAAGTRPPEGEVAPVEITEVTVERLNEISKEEYRGTDVLVFRTTFHLLNPGDELAEIRNFSFTVRVDDGSADKTIVQTTSMPTTYVPGKKEISWSYAAPWNYGGTIGAYVTRGLGEGGVPGAVGKLNEVWEAIGNDEKTFYIDGRYSVIYPDRPDAERQVEQFGFEYTVPEL